MREICSILDERVSKVISEDRMDSNRRLFAEAISKREASCDHYGRPPVLGVGKDQVRSEPTEAAESPRLV